MFNFYPKYSYSDWFVTKSLKIKQPWIYCEIKIAHSFEIFNIFKFSILNKNS